MTANKRTPLAGVVVGLVAVVIAVYSVFFVEWETDVRPAEELVRPVKTMAIESPFAFSGRKYPGKVQAHREVDLAFQVAGPLIELPVRNGEDVKEGQVLARIDPRDFENELNAKKAVLAKARHDVEKVERLFQSGAANQQEVVDTKASFDVADADTKIAEKALDDTYLRAPFGGVIATTFVENFQNIQAKQPVLSLQDVSSVEIEINIPEERVALKLKDKDAFGLIASFDYLPGREFEVELVEFATEADPATQTFAATLAMPAPKDVTVLPGMTATITPYRKQLVDDEAAGFAVPIDAVPVDELGTYFVWKVTGDSGGQLSVQRINVQVGEMVRDEIVVLSGLNKGDRIATAGVHLLREGQQVRLLDAEKDLPAG
jgi:RND family efflux transporter MFP subunit